MTMMMVTPPPPSRTNTPNATRTSSITKNSVTNGSKSNSTLFFSKMMHRVSKIVQESAKHVELKLEAMIDRENEKVEEELMNQMIQNFEVRKSRNKNNSKNSNNNNNNNNNKNSNKNDDDCNSSTSSINTETTATSISPIVINHNCRTATSTTNKRALHHPSMTLPLSPNHPQNELLKKNQKKHVSFDEYFMEFPVKHLSDYRLKDKQNSWYTKEEKKSMDCRRTKLLWRMEAATTTTTTTSNGIPCSPLPKNKSWKISYRGLHGYTFQGAKDEAKRIQRVQRAVLETQQAIWEELQEQQQEEDSNKDEVDNEKDERKRLDDIMERIAESSRQQTKKCREMAMKLAQQDVLDAQQAWLDEENERNRRRQLRLAKKRNQQQQQQRHKMGSFSSSCVGDGVGDGNDSSCLSLDTTALMDDEEYGYDDDMSVSSILSGSFQRQLEQHLFEKQEKMEGKSYKTATTTTTTTTTTV